MRCHLTCWWEELANYYEILSIKHIFQFLVNCLLFVLLLLIVLYPDLKKVSENFFKKQRDQRFQVSHSKMNSSSEIELAPLRSLDDFILSKSRSHFSSLSILLSELASRFQVPDYNNVEKFINRIVSNLIYYQTNYALSTVVIFSLITMMNPFKMFLGMSTMVVCKP